MAEGGDTTFENPAYDPDEPFYDDDRGDETAPFITKTLTPYSYGENIEMQTMQKEKSGLPERSYTVTSFGAPKTSEQAWVAAKDLFRNMSSCELEVSYNTKANFKSKCFVLAKNCTTLRPQKEVLAERRSIKAFQKK